MTEINGIDFDEYLVDCVSIDEDDLNAEYIRVSTDLAYWAKKHGEAEHDFLAAKANVKRAEATAYEQAMHDLADEYETGKISKKPTEKMVEARAQLDPEVEDAHDRYARSAGWRREVEGYVEAIQSKRDMLVSLGADLRKERQNEPYLRE